MRSTPWLVLGEWGMSRQPQRVVDANAQKKTRASVEAMRKKSPVCRTNKSINLNVTIFLNMSQENFEYKNAMDRLETILERIDNSEMEIDELAGQVQEATELLKKCRKILVDTEKNVQDALKSLDGENDG